MKVKLLIPHKQNCASTKTVSEGHWLTPWFFDTYTPKTHFSADSICREKNGDRRWIILRCNDPQCPAQLALQVNEIEELAERLLEGT